MNTARETPRVDQDRIKTTIAGKLLDTSLTIKEIIIQLLAPDQIRLQRGNSSL